MEEPKARIVCDESQVGPSHARSVNRVEQGRVDEIQGRPMDAGIVNARALSKEEKFESMQVQRVVLVVLRVEDDVNHVTKVGSEN
jgi:ribosomal protein L19E